MSALDEAPILLDARMMHGSGLGLMDSTVARKRDLLLRQIEAYGSCAVAFSGGVDSAVAAKAAQLALGDRAVAVTATSPSLAAGELQEATDLARQIGIRHVTIATSELSDERYVENSANRCYFCKTELYTNIGGMLEQLQVQVMLNGANLDDQGDYRPGLKAAGEHGVASPLADCGLTKSEVRQLAQEWELPVWDKPATPCLASRIAYGEEVTVERLGMIDLAEQFLRERGFREVRVRYHRDGLARIELPLAEVAGFADEATRAAVVGRFTELGFRYITLDLQGFRSGSMNAVIPIESLAR